ncbi:MAG: T9SS type B sorting domain-containing protein, partial [Pedobacter sp.]
ATQLTNAVFVDYTVKFAHAITGLTVNNFDLTQTGIGGAYVNSISGSGTTYTVNVGTGGGDGSLALNLTNTTGIAPGISNSLPFAGESYTIDKTAPVTPADLAAVSGNTQNVITWTGNGESDLNKYNLYAGSGGSTAILIATLTAGTNTYAHTGLTNGLQYYYHIEAVDNATNVSTPGNVIYQTPRADQAITLASSDTKVYGTADYNPGATSGTSGTNPIVYTSSNPAVAMIFSGMVHIFGVGTTTITASQGGSDAFNAAPDVTQTLTITAKPIAVTADAKVKVYGTADPALTYTFTPALVNGDAFTGALTRTSGENSGTYAVNQGTLALNPNYSITYTTANLNITAKPVTVTADAKTKVYGAADPALTYTVSPALIAGDVFTGALSRTSGENVGTHAVNQGSLALSTNYTLTYAPANLTITAKPVTVTADAKTKLYGAADPALTYTVAPALVTGDAFTGALSRTSGENTGTYSIGKNTLALNSNYTLTYVGANFTIAAKALVITADNKSRQQGVANPPLTASYAGFINGETNAVLTTQPSLSTTATLASPQGSYPITASGAVAQNYSISYVPGILSVTPGNVTGTAFTAAALYENMPASSMAGTLSATSDDPNATFTYTLVTGAGSTDNALFSITGNQVLTNGSLDFENKPVYSIRIRTTTQFGLSADQVFTISLLDVNEIPTLSQIAPQIVCYTTDMLSVALSGISAGPDANQSVALSVSTNNANLFNSLTVTGNAGSGVLNYTLKQGITGNATVTVTVKDNGGTANGGVDTYTRVFTITVNALPVVTISSDKGSNDLSLGATAVLTATGGVSYQWATAAGIVSGQNTANLSVRPLVNTTYTVTVTNASGCTTTSSFNINVLSDFRMLEESNIVTPNGDGVNDNWIVKNIELYPNNQVTVFDKGGRVVFTAKGYQNSWDATVNGSPLNEGTYYYILDFGDGKGKRKGFITIVRD